MFEEFRREIRRLSQPVSVSIDLQLDDNGYLDRCCPHSECHADFKVKSEDWRDKVPDDLATCPKCGKKSEPSTFNTSSQNQYIEAFAQAYMAQQLNNAFARAARRTPATRISGGPLSVTMSFTYKPARVPIVLPPAAADELRQHLTCDRCDCLYSTIGTGYFCPACGYNDPLNDVTNTIAMVRKSVAALPAILYAFGQHSDADSAANFKETFLEDQVENLISAFQRGSETLFKRLPNASSFTIDANLFQRLEDSTTLWRLATGSAYDAILESAEMELLKKMVHRRHKLTHCQGMVDSKYVQKSGDCAYTIGQRLVTAPDHVLDLANVLQKLFTGLITLVS